MADDEGSQDLYQRVLEAFSINRKTSLARWCLERGIVFTTARSALIGASNSWKARELRRKIIKDARL